MKTIDDSWINNLVSLSSKPLDATDLSAQVEKVLFVDSAAQVKGSSARPLGAALVELGRIITSEREALKGKASAEPADAYRLIDLWGRWLGLGVILGRIVSGSSNERGRLGAILFGLKSLVGELSGFCSLQGRSAQYGQSLDRIINRLDGLQQELSAHATLASTIEGLA